MTKSALIVDDSASARLVLKRVLESHDLAVDACESAEDALEFLESRRPDVIFMDHMMPGMDGFEAVRVIKKNPATATIPIMMYTSQEGEVYVGQARALGAVGVLPKTVKPVEVSRILSSLHLVDDRHAPPPTPAGDGAGLRPLLEQLFAQQRELLQRDLERTWESRLPPPDTEPPPPKRAADRAAIVVLLLVAVSLGVLAAWQFNERQALIDRIRDLASAPAAVAGIQNMANADLADALAVSRVNTLTALEWGINQSGSYGFDEVPLGERRVALLEDLLARLAAVGFSGVIAIDVHVGDFCMRLDAAGRLRLAPPEIDASFCDQLGYDRAEALEIGERQTVAFANFVQVAEARSGGTLSFDIVSRGNAEPLFDYPVAPAGISAGEWNEIAAGNQRVVVSLQPAAL